MNNNAIIIIGGIFGVLVIVTLFIGIMFLPTTIVYFSYNYIAKSFPEHLPQLGFWIIFVGILLFSFIGRILFSDEPIINIKLR